MSVHCQYWALYWRIGLGCGGRRHHYRRPWRLRGPARAWRLRPLCSGKAPPTVQTDVATGLAVTLLGVVAAEAPGVGYALLKLGAQETRVVRAGGLLAPGIRLQQVLPQRVILERNGSRETLAWPRAGQDPATTTSALKP